MESRCAFRQSLNDLHTTAIKLNKISTIQLPYIMSNAILYNWLCVQGPTHAYIDTFAVFEHSFGSFAQIIRECDTESETGSNLVHLLLHCYF
jgi:hypothetical protein